MNKTAFLSLLILLAITVPIAAWLLVNTPQRFSPRNELVGKKLVTGFKPNDIAEVRIADSENEALLAFKDGKWVVANRADYPLDEIRELERLVTSILRLKVGLEIPADAKYYPEMKLLSPDETEAIEKYKEEEKAKGEEPSDPTGLLITLKGEGGKDLSSLVIGSDFGGDPEQPLRGHVLRSLDGNEGVWKVVGSINRRTGDNATGDVRRGPITEPKAWLEYDFLEVEKIKSITLAAPGDAEFKGWSVSRETEEGEFTLPDLTDEEEMNTATAGGFKTLFSNLRFEDVVEPADADAKRDGSKARQVVLTTFDGFTYTVDFAPVKEEEKDEEEGDDSFTPPTNYLATVKVEGSFATERTKEAGETEEQAKAKDQAFAVTLGNLQDKLAAEQGFQGRVYELANFTLSALDKTRADLVQPKQETPPAGATPPGVPGGAPFAPGAATPPVRVPFSVPGTPPNVPPEAPREAVTPPVQVPPAPPAPPADEDENE